MASSFVTPLEYERLPGHFREGRPLFRILSPFVYDIGFKGSGVTVEVEPGFVTDFASIPSLIDKLFGLNPTGRHTKAAVVHDALYASPMLAQILATGIFEQKRAPLKIWRINLGKYYGKARPRLTADLIMFEASGVLGVNFFTRHIHFLGVRLFGRKAFQRAISRTL